MSPRSASEKNTFLTRNHINVIKSDVQKLSFAYVINMTS